MAHALGEMPQLFTRPDIPHILWGGPLGPRPAPRRLYEVDPIAEERVQGDPRGPGGPPHNIGRILSFGKSLRRIVHGAASKFDEKSGLGYGCVNTGAAHI